MAKGKKWVPKKKDAKPAEKAGEKAFAGIAQKRKKLYSHPRSAQE